jgi:hypothetical protein
MRAWSISWVLISDWYQVVLLWVFFIRFKGNEMISLMSVERAGMMMMNLDWPYVVVHYLRSGWHQINSKRLVLFLVTFNYLCRSLIILVVITIIDFFFTFDILSFKHLIFGNVSQIFKDFLNVSITHFISVILLTLLVDHVGTRLQWGCHSSLCAGAWCRPHLLLLSVFLILTSRL